MRFLFVDANYPAFLDQIYGADSELASGPYAAQIQRIKEGLFGEAQFQAAALADLGHEADVVITNAHAAQRAWAVEHGLGDLGRPKRRFRWRRRIVPWWSLPRDAVNWEIVVEQARRFRPDVLYVEIMDTLPRHVGERLRSHTRLTVAQVATDLPDVPYPAYDLIFSSIPSMVERFRNTGIDAEWLPLAFAPAVLEIVGTPDRTVPVSFVGSFSDAYVDRSQIVEAVAQVAGLQTWTGDLSYLAPDSAVRSTVRGSAYGRAMYEVLARSRITLNSHGRVSGPEANNLRLYEATGMGSLLVTDARRNLGGLFDVEREVVTYRSPEEAGDVVRHFLDNPDEARRIAAAGQARTLKDHTWKDRMAQVVEAVNARL